MWGGQSEDSYTAEHGKLRRERSGVDYLVLQPFNRLSLLTPLQNEARSFEDTLLSKCKKKGRGITKGFKNILKETQFRI